MAGPLNDLIGNVIWKKNLDKDTLSLDVDISTLPKGIYFIKGTSETSGEIYSNKLVLE